MDYPKIPTITAAQNISNHTHFLSEVALTACGF